MKLENIKKRLKRLTKNSFFAKLVETIKFKDKRRVAIYSQMKLSKQQKNAIDNLYKTNYGKKIPYTWHRYYSMYTGRFDEKYFPELLFIPLFEKVMNQYIAYAEVYSDKNLIAQLAHSIGIKTARTYVSIVKGAIRNQDNIFITKEEAISNLSNIGKVFIKPTVASSSGRGCFVSEFTNGIDCISNKKIEEIFNSMGEDYVIQEFVECHSTIKRLHESSVNTFRIITYRWKNEICVMPVIMRLGQGGSNIDNAHAGGMFIALDNDGTMHKTAFTEFNKQYQIHPTSGIIFEKYQIPLLPKVIEAAKLMHMAIPQLGCVNWDFTIDKEGAPLLIEANTLGGSIWLIQMAHGCGCFGEKTEEILKWLNALEKASPKKRKKLAFGNINFSEDL